jgi:hypothetical protein
MSISTAIAARRRRSREIKRRCTALRRSRFRERGVCYRRVAMISSRGRQPWHSAAHEHPQPAHGRRLQCLICLTDSVSQLNRETARSVTVSARAQRSRSGVMSVPLDLQKKKCEQRWAAKFARPAPMAAPQRHRPESQNQQLAASAKAKQMTDRAEAAGSRPPQAA